MRFNEDLPEEEVVAAVSAYKRHKQQFNPKNKNNKTEEICGNCGYKHRNQNQPCPATDKFCLKCGNKGHFSRVCRTRRNKDTKLSSAVFLNAFTCSTRRKNTLPRLPTLVGEDFVQNPKHLDVTPETGAEVTIAGEMYLPMLKIKKRNLRVPTETIKHVAGGEVPVIGSCYLSFQIYGQSVIEEVYFVPNISHIFLSIGACKGLKLISPNFPYQNDLRVVATEEEEDLKAFSFGNAEGGQPGITTQLSASTSTKKGEVVWEPPSVMPYEAVEENIHPFRKVVFKNIRKSVRY